MNLQQISLLATNIPLRREAKMDQKALPLSYWNESLVWSLSCGVRMVGNELSVGH